MNPRAADVTPLAKNAYKFAKFSQESKKGTNMRCEFNLYENIKT